MADNEKTSKKIKREREREEREEKNTQIVRVRVAYVFALYLIYYDSKISSEAYVNEF